MKLAQLNQLPVELQALLSFLAALSYRSGNLGRYLHEIACGVSRLIQSDWSIVTICYGETGQVVASSLRPDEGDSGFLVHGTFWSRCLLTYFAMPVKRSHPVTR